MNYSFIDLIYYANFCVKTDADEATRIGDARFGAIFSLVLILCVLINIFSTHVYDLRAIMMAHWIGDSDGFKSITNPKIASMFWAFLIVMLTKNIYLPNKEKLVKLKMHYSNNLFLPARVLWGVSFFGIGIFIPLTSPPDPLPYSAIGFLLVMGFLQWMANYQKSKKAPE